MQPLIDLTFQELELLPLLVVGDLFLIDPAIDRLLSRPVGKVIAKFLQVEPVITIRLLDGRSSDHLLQVVHLCDEVVHCLRDVIEGNRLFIHGKKNGNWVFFRANRKEHHRLNDETVVQI